MTDPPPGLDLDRLAAYLPTVIDGFAPGHELSAALFTGGRSNLTYLLSQGEHRWVLRRPPLGHVMPSAHDMRREYRTLSALSGTGFPAPRPYALCEDQSVLGVPFFLMEYVPGLVVSDSTAAARLAGPEAGHACQELVRTLARLHRAPLPEGAKRSGDYLQRQVRRWTGQWQHTQTRQLPELARLSAWLSEGLADLPADRTLGIVHGDYRLDNLILDPVSFDVKAVLDWEMSTVGDPLMDLALLLVYWQQPDDGLRHRLPVAQGVTLGPGFWSRQRLVDEYARASGVPIDHLDLCVGLACLKLAVIVESIHYRQLAGKTVDELSTGLGDAAPTLVELGLQVRARGGLAALSA